MFKSLKAQHIVLKLRRVYIQYRNFNQHILIQSLV